MIYLNNDQIVLGQIVPAPNGKNYTFLTYENSTHGIKLQYPPNWLKEEELRSKGETAVIFYPINGSSSSYVRLFTEDNPENVTLDDTINQLKDTLSNFTLSESNASTIAGNPAIEITFTFMSKDQNNKGMFVVVHKNNKDYAIYYKAEAQKYDTYLPIIKAMINSLQILPYLTYINEYNEFRIDYPGNWLKIENPVIGLIEVQFSSPPEDQTHRSKAFLNVNVERFPQNMSLENYTKSALKNLKYAHFDIQKNGTATLSGLPGYRVLGLLENPLFPVQQAVMSVWTVKGDNAYGVTYSVLDPLLYSKYYNEAKKMIDSFKIIH